MNSIIYIKINLIGIFLFLVLLLPVEVFKAEELSEKSSINKIKKRNGNIKGKYSNQRFLAYKINPFLNVLENDISIYEPKLDDLKFASKERFPEMDVQSDGQEQKDNIFYARGNVVITLGNTKLTGENAYYDRVKKIFKISGNVTYSKGSQYFEADNLLYNLKTDEGNIQNIYGIIDLTNIKRDIVEREKDISEKANLNEKYFIDNLEYRNTSSIGLVNVFEKDKTLNITDINLDVPTVPKWRFKSKKINIKGNLLTSKRIYFTNDPFNKPQFILESKNFSGEIIDEKIKLVSRNSWVILDNKIKFPVGRRTIYDKDRISSWSLGADFEEKDGWFISRDFEFNEVLNNYQLNIKPYFLFQRALKGKTNSFRAKDSSILSKKVKNEISIADLLALDINFTGLINDWEIGLFTDFNSLNFDRLSESSRSKFILKKSIDLNKSDKLTNNESQFKLSKNNNYQNILDIKLTSSFREEISRGYSGDAEIYFGNSLSIENAKSWSNDHIKSNFSIYYDFGNFTAQGVGSDELITLSRNVLTSSFDYKFPIFKKKSEIKSINEGFRFTPIVLNEGLDWVTNLKSGIFLYSNGSSQSALSISTGPELTLGKFNETYFDYTNLKIFVSYFIKGGDSPFIFDRVDHTLRANLSFDQQLIGPLVFGFDTYLNLDVDDSNYGKFEKSNYSINFQRRAYNVGAYYQPSSETIGIEFQIFNFDYSGKSKTF